MVEIGNNHNIYRGVVIMTIQVLKPKYHVEECLNEIRECLEIGWTGLGFKTVEFENKWKEYTGHENAHFFKFLLLLGYI